MRRLIKFLLGALFGAIIGGVLAILFAPGIGSDTREAFVQKIKVLSSQVRQAMEEHRKALEQEFQKLAK